MAPCHADDKAALRAAGRAEPGVSGVFTSCRGDSTRGGLGTAVFHLFRQAASADDEPQEVDEARRRNDEAYAELRALVQRLLDERNRLDEPPEEPRT
jgi:hypothetical protein